MVVRWWTFRILNHSKEHLECCKFRRMVSSWGLLDLETAFFLSAPPSLISQGGNHIHQSFHQNAFPDGTSSSGTQLINSEHIMYLIYVILTSSAQQHSSSRSELRAVSVFILYTHHHQPPPTTTNHHHHHINFRSVS